MGTNYEQAEQVQEQLRKCIRGSSNANIPFPFNLLCAIYGLGYPCPDEPYFIPFLHRTEGVNRVESMIETINEILPVVLYTPEHGTRASDIIFARYKERIKLKTIGEMFGLTTNAIQQIENKSLRTLRSSSVFRLINTGLSESRKIFDAYRSFSIQKAKSLGIHNEVYLSNLVVPLSSHIITILNRNKIYTTTDLINYSVDHLSKIYEFIVDRKKLDTLVNCIHLNGFKFKDE